jgi:hypothetical protein
MRGHGTVALAGEPAGDVLDVLVDPERLLNDDNRGAQRSFRPGVVGTCPSLYLGNHEW